MGRKGDSKGRRLQCATLAAGPGPEASGNVGGPVRKGPGPVKFTLNYQGLLPPGPVKKNPNFAPWESMVLV